MVRLGWIAVAGALACAQPRVGDSVWDTAGAGPASVGDAGSDAGVESDSDAGSGTESDTDADSETDPTWFPVHPDHGAPIDPTDGCQKVDFLFVVDDSGSMGGEQENLTRSFPGFIDTIRSTIVAQDYQILVTNTNAAGIDVCATLCGAPFIPDCMGLPCADMPALDACDAASGAGKVRDQDYDLCGFDTADRYLLGTQEDLESTFECAARVGTRGNGNEQQATALVDALSPVLNAAGGCNAGFLRDDAILVITLITDEEDGQTVEGTDDDPGSPGTPDQWLDAVLTAKGNNADAVVMLGLVGDTDLPDGECTPLEGANGAEPAPKLREFIQQFDNHVLGSVCAPDYTPFFQSAVDVIDYACDEFEPEG